MLNHATSEFHDIVLFCPW